jgi:hypothetical protein
LIIFSELLYAKFVEKKIWSILKMKEYDFVASEEKKNLKGSKNQYRCT